MGLMDKVKSMFGSPDKMKDLAANTATDRQRRRQGHGCRRRQDQGQVQRPARQGRRRRREGRRQARRQVIRRTRTIASSLGSRRGDHDHGALPCPRPRGSRGAGTDSLTAGPTRSSPRPASGPASWSSTSVPVPACSPPHSCGRGARVIAVELHPERVAHLRRRFGAPVRVVRADASDLRLPRQPFRVVANPPFAVTTQLRPPAARTRLAARRGRPRAAAGRGAALGGRSGTGPEPVAARLRRCASAGGCRAPRSRPGPRSTRRCSWSGGVRAPAVEPRAHARPCCAG